MERTTSWHFIGSGIDSLEKTEIQRESIQRKLSGFTTELTVFGIILLFSLDALERAPS